MKIMHSQLKSRQNKKNQRRSPNSRLRQSLTTRHRMNLTRFSRAYNWNNLTSKFSIVRSACPRKTSLNHSSLITLLTLSANSTRKNRPKMLSLAHGRIRRLKSGHTRARQCIRLELLRLSSRLIASLSKQRQL